MSASTNFQNITKASLSNDKEWDVPNAEKLDL